MVTASERGMRLGKYEIGRTLGEGNFGKVKFARHVESGHPYAVKVLDRKRILDLKIDDQIKREIGTLKLLKHPNVVRLHEVSASKTKIYMVLEYVKGGELFDKIASKGRLSEREGRRLFQQLIDAISYCHSRGVYHRDLKPENVLVDAHGNIKISDFGLSALPQHLGNDGLLHTTCGSPNYIAPEVLLNRGYDGAMSDIWSCGVILYVVLTGSLPFDDRNMAVLYQKIFKGDFHTPKWLPTGAANLIHRILDPNPKTRINVDGIIADDWFKNDYTPVIPYDDDEDDTRFDDVAVEDREIDGADDNGKKIPTHINAFQLIGMSSYLDLSGFFEKEDVSERKIRFTSNYSPNDLFKKIEDIVTEMGFQVQRCHRKLKVMQQQRGSSSPKTPGSLSVAAEVFELGPSLYVVELRKSQGDSSLYRQLCSKLSGDLGACGSHHLMKPQALMPELNGFEGEMPVAAL
ncbi:CBL-interacting protein kinase 1-like [Asparagus officinalis]|uniref:CBL-interacting protein kinase 1-like n=1 Tax=Asparagus officinalis TaxID=4686 RepID=UPI00098E0494|nr:CBL-interacting protein kinase 1-like [Asparagus officinalis]